MTLRDRIAALIVAIGADVKSLGTRMPFSAYTPLSASAITLTAAHHGQILVLTNSGTVTLTVPSTGLPANFYTRILTTSATGWFRVVAGSGATVTSTSGNFLAVKTQYAPADLFAIGAASYLMDSQKLTVAFFQQLVAAMPLVLASTARILSDSYAGNIRQVRRSSDNTLLAVGQTGSVLDSAAMTTFVGSNSAYDATIYDQSGNARNFVQGTAANQPRAVNAGTVEVSNSRPATRGLAAGTWMDSTVSVTTSSLTVGVVGTLNAASSNYGRMVSLGAAGAADYNNSGYAAILDRNNSTAAIQTERNATIAAGGTVTYGTPFSYIVRWDGTNVTPFLNGVAGTAVANSGAFGASILRILAQTSNDQLWDGNFMELFAYGSALTNADIAALYANQKTFFALT